MEINLEANEPSKKKVNQAVINLPLPTAVEKTHQFGLSSLFRQYDIRGIVEQNFHYEETNLHCMDWSQNITLTPALAYALGCAYGSELLERLSRNSDQNTSSGWRKDLATSTR